MKHISFKLFIISFCLLFTNSAFSQKIPFITNISQYNVKEGNISSMRVNVYSVENKDGKIMPKTMADYGTIISFDSLGNRVKEVIYDMKAETTHTNLWDYNTTNETVGQYILDIYNREIGKKIFQSNAKEKKANIKTYGMADTLITEENWAIGTTGKTINLDKFYWDIKREIIARKTSRSYDISEGKSIEYLVKELGDGEDYSWLPNILRDWANAKDKKTRIEVLPDGTKIEYIFDDKKDLMLAKKRYDKDGKLIQDVSYQYEFDGNGNWTKVTELNANIPQIIAIRTFEFRVKPVVVKKSR